jgi:hypothetical protein
MAHGSAGRIACFTQRALSAVEDIEQRAHSGLRRAVVIGRWGEDTALLRTDDGETLEAPVPEALRAGFDVGSEARLDRAAGDIVGWGSPGAR